MRERARARKKHLSSLMAVCHFYKWSIAEVRDLSQEEWEAAVKFANEFIEKSKRG